MSFTSEWTSQSKWGSYVNPARAYEPVTPVTPVILIGVTLDSLWWCLFSYLLLLLPLFRIVLREKGVYNTDTY